MSANPDFDALLATTLKNYEPTLVDNVFSSRPLFAWIKDKGRMKSRRGGAKLVLPLVHALNDTAGSYSMYDTIPTTPQEGISAAEYSWGQFAASIAIAGLEEAMNAGEEEVIDLLEAKTMQAENTISEKLDEMLFLSGTGNGGKDFLGLAALVDATGDVGGIDQSTNAFWASYEETTAEVLTLAKMATAYNTASIGNDKPNAVFTTQTLFEKYESLLQPQLRYEDAKMADAGFQSLTYKGQPVTFDTYCQTGVVYFLNSKYIWFVKLGDNWFRTTPFKQPTNQDARFAQIICYGQFATNARRYHAKLTGKTA